VTFIKTLFHKSFKIPEVSAVEEKYRKIYTGRMINRRAEKIPCPLVLVISDRLASEIISCYSKFTGKFSLF
jgi:hypothetical protein